MAWQQGPFRFMTFKEWVPDKYRFWIYIFFPVLQRDVLYGYEPDARRALTYHERHKNDVDGRQRRFGKRSFLLDHGSQEYA